ncbi:MULTISPECIES: cation diffusion facilitator family transporter [unclassified Halomonas]|uniref:cation diffusion facilitator family transporter n=1 Tax=unclassified Halomonas TaxID=2609666 RepID=UPI0006D9F83A|nr:MULTISPECIES: cation diffusion facilitator family transporter [unclassified Halomonas]KPQ22400.1 MAG: putative Co/Zn/Cd cation transporter [Halomonas sp. HL-93]SBR47018.1 cation diffusion facilitator family transporter [Halomonas sp. HL-93]
MKTESRTLAFSALMALLIGCAGIAATLASNSQAILLDGLFNLIYFSVALVTIKVSKLASRPDSESYPFGYSYFESLVNLCKGLLILGVSIFALVDAIAALLSGGREIAAGLAVLYALFATAVCSLTAWVMHRSQQHVHSPLVSADKLNWVVNSVISAAVLAAFCLVMLFEQLGWHTVLPYVDSVLVIAVVLLCLGVPVRMASQSLQELLNKSPEEAIAEPVRQAVARALADTDTQEVRVRIVRPGRLLYVMVHVVLPDTSPNASITQQDALRAHIDEHVRRYYSPVICDVVFTADTRWAAPSCGLLVETSH